MASRCESPARSSFPGKPRDCAGSKSGAARRTRGPCPGSAGGESGFYGQEAFALQALAGELARPANCFRLLARFSFGRFFVVTAKLHLAEDALALHLFLQRLEGLIDVVVTDKNLHASFLLLWSCVLLDDPGMRMSPPTCRRSVVVRALCCAGM